jgi:hypothetical protein
MGKNEFIFSLHEFRLIVENDKNKLSNEDFIKHQENMLTTSGIKQRKNDKITKEIRMKCEIMGKQGWAISPFWRPRQNETWYDTWFWMIYNGLEEKIVDYFLEKNNFLLKEINAFSRLAVGRYDWFTEAEYLFEEHRYTSCAMLLTAILEESIRRCPIEGWRGKVVPFFEKIISSKLEYYYNKNLEPLNRYIETVLLLPSIDGFLNSYFDSGYPFGKNKEDEEMREPLFLERNWLMHGMTKRNVIESDCVKLFNAICSLNYILQTLF